jgi:hypothetical protein
VLSREYTTGQPLKPPFYRDLKNCPVAKTLERAILQSRCDFARFRI